MKGIFVDAGAELAEVFRRVSRPGDPPIRVNVQPQVEPAELPGLLAGSAFVLNDHSFMPAEIMARCAGLKHVIFLGTGARSYMDPEALARLGITVHIIKGYGDTAVAEHAIALMWAAARGLARMDRSMREGQWLRTEGLQLTGNTIGLIGYGGIAAEVARMAGGMGMRVLAWNCTPRAAAGVAFVPLEQLLAESHVVSLHLLLTDETRGFLDAARLAQMRPGAILVNTARGAVVDEAAMIGALLGQSWPCGAGCVPGRAAAAGSCADAAGERDAFRPQRVPDTRGEREPDPACAGHRERGGRVSQGLILSGRWPAWRNW